MNYQEFLNYIEENLPIMMNERAIEQRKQEMDGQEHMPIEDISYEAHIHSITKNNGIVLDGVTLLNKGECSGPNIYLNAYFDSYQMGKPLNAIMEEIIICHQRAKEENTIDIVDILDFDIVRDKVIIRLVNYEKNKDQLEGCPHKRFLDLAVTFRYLVGKDALGLASSLISNKEYEQWNIDLDDLYQIALSNTMREFPWRLDSLMKIVTECFEERLPEHLRKQFQDDVESLEQVENRINMYVLSNDIGLNGATSILYDHVVEQFAKEQGCNVFVLPSSVHEVMIVPENEETDANFLQSLVIEANQSAVGLIDLLSDHIYYYNVKECKWVVWDDILTKGNEYNTITT